MTAGGDTDGATGGEMGRRLFGGGGGSSPPPPEPTISTRSSISTADCGGSSTEASQRYCLCTTSNEWLLEVDGAYSECVTHPDHPATDVGCRLNVIGTPTPAQFEAGDTTGAGCTGVGCSGVGNGWSDSPTGSYISRGCFDLQRSDIPEGRDCTSYYAQYDGGNRRYCGHYDGFPDTCYATQTTNEPFMGYKFGYGSDAFIWRLSVGDLNVYGKRQKNVFPQA